MSALEVQAQRYLQPLLMGERCAVDIAAQGTIALWSLKTAMVLEALDLPDARTYTQTEREQLRALAAIPWRTSVWLAASVDPSVFMSSKHRYFGISIQAPSGVSVTMAFAHVVLQVFTMRVPKDVGPSTRVTTAVRRGPWAEATVRIWPVQSSALDWPPPMGLNGEAGLDAIADRFSPATDGDDPVDELAV